jgi:hypothetical protein
LEIGVIPSELAALLSPASWFLLKPLSLKPATSLTSAALKLLFCVVVVLLPPPPPPPQPAATRAIAATATAPLTSVRVLLKMVPSCSPLTRAGSVFACVEAILERHAAVVLKNYSVAAYEWYWLSSTSTRLGFEPS